LWWFELADMTEKLFLTSLLGFIPTEWQCPAGMLAVFVYIAVLQIQAPYVRSMDDRLSALAQSYLLLTLLISLVLQQNAFERGSFEDIAGSVIMLGVVAALTIVILVHLFIFIRRFVRNRQRESAHKRAKEQEEMVRAPTTARSPSLVPPFSPPDLSVMLRALCCAECEPESARFAVADRGPAGWCAAHRHRRCRAEQSGAGLAEQQRRVSVPSRQRRLHRS
jgi:hypothetical protein